VKKKITSRRRGVGWAALSAVALALGGVAWSGFGVGQSPAPPQRTGSSGVFTPAHASVGEAIRHFFGLREPASQPIAFSHQVHVEEVGLGCDFCHDGASVGPAAGLPGIETCMLCHSGVGLDLPEVQVLLRHRDEGIEPGWERVYGWPEESHVRFNHRPHYIRGVGCASCHGDVSRMGAAERAVEHTMAFCVDCHEQEQASNECTACHY